MYKYIEQMLWAVSIDNNSKLKVNIFERDFTQNAGNLEQENLVCKNLWVFDQNNSTPHGK